MKSCVEKDGRLCAYAWIYIYFLFRACRIIACRLFVKWYLINEAKSIMWIIIFLFLFNMRFNYEFWNGPFAIGASSLIMDVLYCALLKNLMFNGKYLKYCSTET